MGSIDRGVSGSVVAFVVVVVVVAGVVISAVVAFSSSVVVVVVTCSPSDDDSLSDWVVAGTSSPRDNGVENKISSSSMSAAILSLSNSFSGSRSLIWFPSRPPFGVSPLAASFFTFDWNDLRVCCRRALLLNVT